MVSGEAGAVHIAAWRMRSRVFSKSSAELPEGAKPFIFSNICRAATRETLRPQLSLVSERFRAIATFTHNASERR
jgi:hypothetical protein